MVSSILWSRLAGREALMIDVGTRCNYLQAAPNELCRAGSCGDVQKRTTLRTPDQRDSVVGSGHLQTSLPDNEPEDLRSASASCLTQGRPSPRGYRGRDSVAPLL